MTHRQQAEGSSIGTGEHLIPLIAEGFTDGFADTVVIFTTSNLLVATVVGMVVTPGNVETLQSDSGRPGRVIHQDL